MKPVSSQTLLGWTMVLALAGCASFSNAQTRKNRPTAFFPLNASGGDLCDFTSDATFFAGNWWCVKPDGTNASGAPVTLSCSGTCTAENALVYPAGLDRGPGLQQRMGTTSSRFQSAAVAAPTGDFSACAVENRDALSGTVDPLAQDATAGGSHNFILNDWPSSGTATAILYKSDNTSTSVTFGSGAAQRAYHLFCATYHRVGDGTSRFTTYLDGTQQNQSTTAKAMNNASDRWTLGGLDYGTAAVNGAVRGGFMTEVELTAAQVAQLDRHVHGGVGYLAQLSLSNQRTAYETAISCTRSSLARFISPIANGVVQTVAANTPRIGPDGFYSDGTATNLLLQSEAFNTTWLTYDANLTVTADTVVAPDGQTTADSIIENSAANTFHGVYQSVTLANATDHIYSIFAKRGPLGEQYLLLDFADTVARYAVFDLGTGKSTFNSAAITILPTQTLANGWYRLSMRKTTIQASNNIQAYQNDSPTTFTSHVGVVNATIYLWGAQLEAVADGSVNSSATAYIPTTTTAVARSADACDWTPSTNLSTTEGCMRFCTTPQNTAESAAIAINGSATSNRLGYISGASYFAYDGTHSPSITTAESAGLSKCFRTTWTASGNALKVENLTDGTNASTAFAAFPSLSGLRLGHSATIAERGRYISGLQFGTASSDCQ